MFVRSFSNFKKKLFNFKFELVENRLTEDSDVLILENKEQALNILYKKGIRQDDPTFVLLSDLIEKTFNNLNYLGLITKFIFEQNASVDEIKDLLPWLKQSGNKLPKNPLKYKTFENLKDDIIKTDNIQRVKVIYNKLPRDQKNLIINKSIFFEKALAIHKLGISKEFGRKLSLQKTEKDLIEYMDDFIDMNSDDITFDGILSSLRSLNVKILINDPDTGVIMAEILDFKASSEMGSSDWCISTGIGQWNNYTAGSRRQFFMWDFSESKTSSLFLIGFTSNSMGQIIHIHDKYDVSLSGVIPNKVRESLKNINISTDPFEYKHEILKKLDQGLGEKIPYIHDSNNNQDIIIIKISDGKSFQSFKSEKWGNYNPFPYSKDVIVEFNFYVIYNFNHPLDDDRFSYSIESSDDNIMIFMRINDNGGNVSYLKITGGETIQNSDAFDNDSLISDLYTKGYLVPKDIEEINDEKKNDYLDRIEKIVKGEIEISDKWRDKKSRYINTSDDPGSTGEYWLFKIENDELGKFCNGIIDKWDPFRSKKISNFYVYVLIKLDESFRSPNFIRFIKLGESNKEIMYNLKEGDKYNTNIDIPLDIKEFIDKGYIEIKSNSQYNKEVSEEKRRIFGESNHIYDNDDKEVEYAKALLDYLISEGDIDIDEDDEDDEDNYRRLLIAKGRGYNLLSFQIYESDMITSNHGGGSEYSIGNDNEADREFEQKIKDDFDEMGSDGFVDWVIKDNIDGESIAEYLIDGLDYFEDMVRESPEDYSLEKEMSDENIELLEKKIEERDEADDKLNQRKEMLEKAQDRSEKYDEFVESKLNKIDELQVDGVNEEDPDYQRKFNRLEVIKNKLIKRSTINKERYENIITNIEYEISDLEEKLEEYNDLIYEMEDTDNDDYWEISDESIESVAESERDSKKQEIEDDPLEYLKEMGYDGDSLKNLLNDHIDIDGLINDCKNDGRGSISEYDGEEREHTYNGVNYYIYKIN